MAGTNQTLRVHDIRAYAPISGHGAWAKRALLIAALSGAVPSNARAKDIYTQPAENVSMQRVRGKPEELAHTTQELQAIATELLGRYHDYLENGGTPIQDPEILRKIDAVFITYGYPPGRTSDDDRVESYLLLAQEGKGALDMRLDPIDRELTRLEATLPAEAPAPPAPTPAPVQAPPVQAPPTQAQVQQQVSEFVAAGQIQTVAEQAADLFKRFVRAEEAERSDLLRQILEIFNRYAAAADPSTGERAMSEQFMAAFEGSLPARAGN